MTRITRGARLLAIGGLALVPLAACDNYSNHVSRVPHDHTADKGSRARGDAKLSYDPVTGNLSVHLKARGLTPNVPHLIHIHGDPTKKVNDCPDATARSGRVDDGLIDTAEGLPDYGAIVVTFSTSGGTGDMMSPDALDTSRAPVSDANGNIDYQRTFPISRQIGENLSHLHVVIHGLDLSGNGTYDGGAGSLGPNVPLEAELPVSCGPIDTAWWNS